MKFYIKNYEIKSSKIKHDFLIAHITDAHINDKFDYLILKEMINEFRNTKPDLICFTGDLIDESIYGDSEFLIEYLGLFLDVLAKIAPIYMVKGNHDLLYREDDGLWYYHDSKKLFDYLSNIKNLNILTSETNNARMDFINLSGVDYGEDIIKAERTAESSETFKHYLLPKIKNVYSNLNPDMFNILLIHQPKHLYDYDFSKFSLILSGHTHDGTLPNFLDKFLSGNRGVTAPVKGSKLFPEYAIGIKAFSEDTTSIIASPITMSADYCDNILVKKLYKPGITYINVKHN